MHRKITIIIPVYNTEKYLCKCLDSVLAQTFTDFECILIDDFSKDNSFNICENYAKKDNRIIALKNSENIGASLTRKKGLDHAKGEYIQFVDSDDYIESDMLEKMHEKASAENLDIVFCDFIVLRESGNLYVNADVENRSKIEIIRHIGIKLNSVTANSWNKIIKKQIFDNVIFSNTSYAEDKYTSLQTAYYAKKIGYVNAAFYNYVKNSDSSTENVNYFLRRKKEHFYNYKLVVKFLIEKYGKDISQFEPELSDGINSLKMEIISDEGLNSTINIDELYINANAHIFRKTWKAKLVSKIVFYLVAHKFPLARNILNLYIFAKKILY